MGRHALRITIVLGMLVTLLGGTGIFATFTDRATAGDNSVTTGERARAAELKIAAEDPSQYPAGTPLCMPAITPWQDDTTTGQFTAGSLHPGDNLQPAYLCLWNAGTATLTLTASAIGLADEDVDCTGDEAAAGDETCGLDETTGLPQAGELSPLVAVDIDRTDCSDPSTVIGNGTPAVLSQFDAQTVQLGGAATGNTMPPDQIICLRLQGSYSTGSETQAQLAQSDRVTWKFAFDGTAQ